MAVQSIIVGGRRFPVTGHALTRYQERVMPALEGAALAEQLRRVAQHGEFTTLPPAWVTDPRTGGAFIVLAEGIVLTVSPDGVVLTCLTRAEPGDAERSERASRRRERSEVRARPGKREKHGQVARAARRRRREWAPD